MGLAQRPRIASQVPRSAAGLRIALVASRWNAEVTERLLGGARQALEEHGADPDALTTIFVPGAFEIPAAAAALARRRKDPMDAIVALGCILRGQTVHFDLIARTVAHGLDAVARTHGVGLGFGVLAVDNLDQGLARSGGAVGNAGADAALAAVEMARVLRLCDGTVPWTSGG